MAQQSREQLKTYFQTGDIPTEQHYIHLIDTFSVIGADQNSGDLVLSGSINTTGSISVSGSLGVNHQIVLEGSMTASGNISSSGQIYATSADISGSVYANNFKILSGSTSIMVVQPGWEIDPALINDIYIGTAGKRLLFNSSDTLFQTGDVSIKTNTTIGDAITDKHVFNGHITASHNISSSGYITAATISASGTVYADNFTSVGGDTAGISFTDGVLVTGNVTASGNIEATGAISASGTIYGNLINANGSVIQGDMSTTGDFAANTGTGSFEYLTSTKFIGSRPILTKTSNTTLALTDAGTYNRCGSHNIIIPVNSSVAFSIGTEIEFIQTSSTGHLHILSASNDITLNSRHSIYSASGQFSAISCKKVATNEWDIIGDLTA